MDIREMMKGISPGTPCCEVVSPETLRPCGAPSIIRYRSDCPGCGYSGIAFACETHKSRILGREVGCYYCRTVVQVKVSL